MVSAVGQTVLSLGVSGAALVKKDGQTGMAVQADSVMRTELATCFLTVTK